MIEIDFYTENSPLTVREEIAIRMAVAIVANPSKDLSAKETAQYAFILANELIEQSREQYIF
jgi:hypothetical protein